MYKYAVITVSDSVAEGKREDVSATEIVKLLDSQGFFLAEKVCVPDEVGKIRTALLKFCKKQVDLILTTGGTGFSPRDVTPEATKTVVVKEASGIVEAIRHYSMQFTPRAMLSRAVCGINDKSIILNLPGSPKAVVESLKIVLPSLLHGLDILNGGGNCARSD